MIKIVLKGIGFCFNSLKLVVLYESCSKLFKETIYKKKIIKNIFE